MKGLKMEIIKLENNNGELTTTSLEIARITGKEHKAVMRDIRSEFEIGTNLGRLKYYKEDYRVDSRNRQQLMYKLTKRGAIQLMSRYSKEVRTMVLDEFERMEDYIKSQETPNKELGTLEILKLATAEIEKLSQRNEQLTDNLLAYQKYGKSLLVREFVKIVYDEDKIEISEREMWKLLDSKYLMSNRLPYAQYKKYFSVSSVVKNGEVRRTTRISTKGILYFTNKLLKMVEE